MGPGNALAGEGRAAGDVEEMAVDVVLHALEVVGGDLPGHVEGDPALQAQHQLREGPVQVVDHVEVQALFQQHGKAEHVLLFEVLVLGHIVHGHVAAEEHRVRRPPQYRGLQKVQLPGAHLLQSVVGFAQRQLEGGGGDLQLVKMDGVDVRIEVEAVQLLQEGGDIAPPLPMPPAQPLHQAPVEPLLVLTAGSRQLRQDVPLRRGVAAPEHMLRHGGDEALGVRRAALAAADAGEVGGVVIGAPGQVGDTDGEGGEQGIQRGAQVPGVEALLRKEGAEALRHGLLRQGGDAPALRQAYDAGDELRPLRLALRPALPAAVAADGGRRQAAGIRQLPA